MKISGKVVFHAGNIQHNQATFEGVELMADMLTAQRIRTITNCFMIPAFDGALIGGSPIDWGWNTLQPYLVGNKLYASVVAALDNKFGTMTAIAQGRSSEDGASKIVNTVLFPAGKGTVPSTTVFYLVLVAGGNTTPYDAAGYQATGNEVVLAVVDMTTNPITFTPDTDNNFTWTIFITPETE